MHKTSAWPLALIHAALIVFASLFPFDGWRDQGIDPWIFLSAPLPPPYWTGFDVAVNVAGYVPLGFLLALLMSRFTAVEKMVFPYLMIIQMIPILGMAPIVLAITKDIDKSRIVIAAILTFYPVATNTLSGFKAVEKEKRELMYSLAASRWDIYRKLLIPYCIPYLFTGLKIAAPMAITASILVDTLQGGGGLGCMMSQSLKHAMTIYVFWQIVFLSAIIGILSYQLMVWLEKLLSPYPKDLRGSRGTKELTA